MSRAIAFMTPPAPGHVYPTLPLVQQLVARGHQVSYVTSPALAAEVTAAGAQAVELDWQPDTSGLLPGADFSFQTLLTVLDEALDVTEAAFPYLLERFRRDRVELVCFDSVVLGPLLAAALGARTVSLVPNLVSNEHFSLAEILPGFDPAHPGLAAHNARIADFATRYGITAPNPTGGPAAGLTLVFLPREFQIAGDTFDDSYRFIGPSVGARADRGRWEPPHGDTPVLLISLGTAFNNRPEFFASCVAAFGDTPWQVVMAVGDHIDPAVLGSIPANIEVAPDVPQLAVLRHATAFVSHAGMGSTMEALYHQVPLIAVPQVREQAVNARRLEELGLGRRLPSSTPTAHQLRAAVDQVATDPVIRHRLAEMKRVLDAAGGAVAGADAIEEYCAATRRQRPDRPSPEAPATRW